MARLKDKNIRIKKLKSKVKYKKLNLSNDISFDLAISSCVDEQNKITINNEGITVQCKNGITQIHPSYCQKEVTKIGGYSIELLIKEITDSDELKSYESLSQFHYKGQQLFGRTSVLIATSTTPYLPKVLGYIELATPFYVNKPRAELLNAPFGPFRIYAQVNSVNLGRLLIGSDSVYSSLELNDDTIPGEHLRKIKLSFDDQISPEVYDYLSSVYGKPDSHTFKLGNPVLQSTVNVNANDTSVHLWTWKKDDMLIEHLYNVYPPDSSGTSSYIEYKIAGYDRIKEEDRQTVLKSMYPSKAVEIKIDIKYPDPFSPTVEIYCQEINNKDILPGRRITSIKGNARFSVPLSDTKLTIPNISVTLRNPVPYFSTIKYDTVITIFKVSRLDELRPQYQSAVKAMSNAERVEKSFDVTEVQFSDGTILKDN